MVFSHQNDGKIHEISMVAFNLGKTSFFYHGKVSF